MVGVIEVSIFFVGLVIGLVIALILTHKKFRFYLPKQKDPWAHLEQISKERAEIRAKQKALQKAFSNRTIDEAIFVSKDAEYTHLIEKYDVEIETIINRIAYSELPEELKKSQEQLRQAGDIRTLAKTIKQLEKEKIELQHQMENKQIQMRDIDEERKRTLAKKNQLEEKYDAIGEEMKKEKNKVEKLSKTREKLEDRISDLEAKESPSEELNNLKRENRLLRESLEEKNKRMNQLSKNLGVLKTVFDKYTDIIEEKESKTAEELKRLVQPNNQGIISVAKAYNTPKKAFEFVRDNISEVTPNISATYWLTVDDMLRLRAADTEDESILLCSLLRTLGENAHVIVVELDRGTVKTIVSLEDRILDPSIKSNFDDYVGISEEEALKKYMFNGEFVKQVLYRFNDKNYQTQGEQ
ncbi:hypothetical protein K8R43_04845 [archaeon]|nr:hypothetical protein [archaeon]